MKMPLKIAALSLSVVSLFSVMGCRRMSMEEYQQLEQLNWRQSNIWRKEMTEVENNIAIANEKLTARWDELDFLKRKAALLEKENESLSEYWKSIRVDSRDAFSSVLSQLNENQDLFFDVRYGEPVRKLTKTWQRSGFTVMVDFGRPILEDCSIQAVEVFSSRGPVSGSSNRLQVLLLRRDIKGLYAVHSVSPTFAVSKVGKNSHRFLQAPMHAKKGDYYGLLVYPGTSIDYNELALGQTQGIGLAGYSDNPMEIAVAAMRPQPKGASAGIGNLSVAFSVLGMSVQKYIFLANAREAMTMDKPIKNISFRVKCAVESDIQRNVYLAVFHPSPNSGSYYLTALSDRMILPRNGDEVVGLTRNDMPNMSVSKGDICVLVIAPGLNRQNLAFPNEKYKMFEQPFFPFSPYCEVTFPSGFTPGDTKNPEVKYTIDFSVQ